MKQGEPRQIVCSNCGEMFTGYSNNASMCPDCRKKKYREREMAKRKKLAAEQRKTNEERREDERRREARRRSGASWKEIEAVQAKAEKAGLSYGKYVAKLEGEKR